MGGELVANQTLRSLLTASQEIVVFIKVCEETRAGEKEGRTDWTSPLSFFFFAFFFHHYTHTYSDITCLLVQLAFLSLPYTLARELQILLTATQFPTIVLTPAASSKKTPPQKIILGNTSECRNLLSGGQNNASAGFTLIARWLGLHSQYNDASRRRHCCRRRCRCAPAMFSSQTHNRKCRHLTECHSQGYCLSFPCLLCIYMVLTKLRNTIYPQTHTQKRHLQAPDFQAGSLRRQGGTEGGVGGGY